VTLTRPAEAEDRIGQSANCHLLSAPINKCLEEGIITMISPREGPVLDEETLKSGIKELDSLARDEYHESLEEVLADTEQERSAVRIGRLVGVILKEPFAKAVPREEPSIHTAAYRAWHLVDLEDFNSPARMGTWQYKALDEMRHEGVEYLTEFPSVYELAYYAQYESGFFGYFAQILRKYICRDPAIRKKVEEAINESTRLHAHIPKITPESIVGTGGLALSVYLVQTIPMLGFVGAPVIAATVVILYTLGVNAFCTWSDGLRTDLEERH
jgi:hypothetical protein